MFDRVLQEEPSAEVRGLAIGRGLDSVSGHSLNSHPLFLSEGSLACYLNLLYETETLLPASGSYYEG